ncbi:hypothetical protein [Nostoc sp.]|uniref:hypothetical protein n=1 Tax=Nostoc sp. TaxID=1180 RepID=UPI002FFABC44
MNFFNLSKSKAPAISLRSSDPIHKRNHGGIISVIDVKTTLLGFASFLVLTTAISSGMASAHQASNPQKTDTGKSISEKLIANFRPKPDEVVQPTLLPEIGKWMLNPDFTPADWLGEIYQGKTLREPINIIIVGPVANSPEEAKNRLIAACTAAGYPSREGHSSGYWGYIDEQLQAQFPQTQDHAFSNELYIFNNNHGRIFGPYRYKGACIFIGAFSREKVMPFSKIKHQFVSFDQARDDFAKNINLKTEYQINGYLNLDNAIVNNPKITTADYDGMAILLKAKK